jgi:synaptobrevin family protein YKT6
VAVYRQVSETSAWCLASASQLSDFGYFSRSTISQHIQFACRTCVQRTRAGCRQSVQLDNEQQFPFVAHVSVRFDGLAGVVMADKEYPPRVAFTLINRALAAYEERVGVNWRQMDSDQQSESDYLQADIALNQDPRKADRLTASQTQLDDMKDVEQTNIEQLLQREETLDSLMARSEDLGLAAAQFYNQARRANTCCWY